MERNYTAISWARSCPTNIYKITESTNRYSSSTENSNNNVPGQYVFDESHVRGTFHGTRYLDLCAAASRVCNKCKEVDPQSSGENQISRAPNLFFDHDIHFTKRESIKFSKSMSGGFTKSYCTPLETSQSDRLSALNSSGNNDISSRLTDECYKVKLLLPSFVRSEFELSGGTKMVDNQFRIEESQAIITQVAQVMIHTDASKRHSAGERQCIKEESVMHINILGLKRFHLALLTFTRLFETMFFMPRWATWLLSLI